MLNQQPRKLLETKSKAIASKRRVLPLLPGLDPSRSQTFYAIASGLLLVLLSNGIGLTSPLNPQAMNPSQPSGEDATEMN